AVLHDQLSTGIYSASAAHTDVAADSAVQDDQRAVRVVNTARYDRRLVPGDDAVAQREDARIQANARAVAEAAVPVSNGDAIDRHDDAGPDIDYAVMHHRIIAVDDRVRRAVAVNGHGVRDIQVAGRFVVGARGHAREQDNRPVGQVEMDACAAAGRV